MKLLKIRVREKIDLGLFKLVDGTVDANRWMQALESIDDAIEAQTWSSGVSELWDSRW